MGTMLKKEGKKLENPSNSRSERENGFYPGFDQLAKRSQKVLKSWTQLSVPHAFLRATAASRSCRGACPDRNLEREHKLCWLAISSSSNVRQFCFSGRELTSDLEKTHLGLTILYRTQINLCT